MKCFHTKLFLLEMEYRQILFVIIVKIVAACHSTKTEIIAFE